MTSREKVDEFLYNNIEDSEIIERGLELVDNLENDYVKQLKDQNKDFKNKINDISQNFQNKITNISQNFQKEINNLNDELDDTMKKYEKAEKDKVNINKSFKHAMDVWN